MSEHISPVTKIKLKKLKTDHATKWVNESSTYEKIAILTKKNRVIAYVHPVIANQLIKLTNFEKKCDSSIIQNDVNLGDIEDITWLNLIVFKKWQDMPWYLRFGAVEIVGKGFVAKSIAKTLINEKMAIRKGSRKITLLYEFHSFKERLLKIASCVYCSKMGETIDHIRPKSRGGITTFMNCAPACHDCNITKANYTLEEITKVINQ